MRENTKQTLAVTIITLCLAVSVFLFLRVISPERDQLKETMSDMKSAEADKSELEKYKVLAEKLASESAQMETQISDIKAVLPSSPETAEILATLDVLAKQNGLVLDKIDFTFGNAERQNSSQTTTDLPALINAQLTLRGNYLNFKTFLQEVEKEKRLLNLFGLVINNKTVAATSIVVTNNKPKVVTNGSPSTVLEYQVSLTAYYQL
ncbi:MAG TPA: type 4a pilus biogenesis protein PilO [Candidatus Paceibacterota bacterium]|nr:type 4a pilus biogenesis protein PilO [Candidatus Paceibacterota bacterium]